MYAVHAMQVRSHARTTKVQSARGGGNSTAWSDHGRPRRDVVPCMFRSRMSAVRALRSTATTTTSTTTIGTITMDATGVYVCACVVGRLWS